MPSRDFDYTGGWQKWAKPDRDIEWVDVTLIGAGSGESRGSRVTGRINVKRIQALHFLVGQGGERGGGTTVGGGGAAGRGRGRANGWSGGGATVVRAESRTGALKAVAAGAGGASGDGGVGGNGGGDVGQAGFPASVLTVDVGNATGGTQIQGGVAGRSALPGLDGNTAGDGHLSVGGAGATSALTPTYGGGGGGGGYRGGGGGQAGLDPDSPGGGGGGGSDYTGALTSFTSEQGDGSLTDGRIIISWVSPKPANQPPTPPTEVKVGGKDYSDEMPTFSKGRLQITAKVNDPNSKKVRMVAFYSPDRDFRQRKAAQSTVVERGKVAKVQLEGLTENTLWYARLYTRDSAGLLSVNYTALKFWTNRFPLAPNLLSPGDNATIPSIDSVVFGWSHLDADHPENAPQRGFEFQWRRAGSPIRKAGEWQSVTFKTDDETYVGEPGQFTSNTLYEWRVRTQDQQQSWGTFSEIRSFFIGGTNAPPWPLSPVGGEALVEDEAGDFTWSFHDPDAAAVQTTADLRYRAVGTSDWITWFGDTTLPGPDSFWLRPVLPPGHYEWQVRTYSSASSGASDWGEVEHYWVVAAPDRLDPETYFSDVTSVDARLGCGVNTLHVYQRGARHYVGQIKPLIRIQYDRRRDDIGVLIAETNGFGPDCAQLLRDIHPWTHEVVVWRDGERAWEGPITLLTDTPTGYRIEAKDVLAYPYRRIMRQGYNDAFRVTNNVELGLRSVVDRARQILLNALAPDDPNVLAYLTTFNYHDDARQSRSVPDFAKMAWEELDSLASTAGLDYTVIGRRILLWDTHRPIGRLPEMRTHHFSTAPIVSEYGMQLATDFGVTNNNGVYGLATRRPNLEVPAYGIVEQLASAYGETEGGAPAEALTAESAADLEVTLALQAERNIANRYPTPKIVRVPDNSALSPDAPVRLDHLVPGVWIPLRATGTVEEVAQWQKLDSVTVGQTEAGEQVQVVMSPAPNAGADPDAEGDVEAESA
jgi:hypothetical protein